MSGWHVFYVLSPRMGRKTSPLDRLAGVEGTVYSIDLKADTDRWPLLFMFELFQALFDRSFASAAINSALATNIFIVSFIEKKETPSSFVAGHSLWDIMLLGPCSRYLTTWYAMLSGSTFHLVNRALIDAHIYHLLSNFFLWNII